MSGPNNWLGRLAKGEDGGNPPKNTRKVMLWLAGAIVLGVVLLVMGSSGSQSPQPADEKKVEAGDPAQTTQVQKTMMATEEEALAAKLQAMLERIDGSGSVRVTVRLASSARETYAVNTTTGRKTTLEKDQGGGTRTINENSDSNQLVMARNSRGDSPMVEVETASRVAGVLVVAGGAGNPRVKEMLFDAIRVALDVEPHKILVLTGQGGIK